MSAATWIKAPPSVPLIRAQVGWHSARLPLPNPSFRYAAPGEIQVGIHADGTHWVRGFPSSMWAGWVDWERMTTQDRLQHVVNSFLFFVLSEGIDPQAIHRECWKIAEYRELELAYSGAGARAMFQNGVCSPYNP